MFPERDRLYGICKDAVEKLEFTPGFSAIERLDLEMKEIDAQAEHEYFLDLYDKKAIFQHNEHNLIVPYLLGLVDEFDATKEPAYLQGEYPDIDIDYLQDIQEYLKNVWAPKAFGEENVCSIGTYGVLGIKSALKDVTRTFGVPRDEVEIVCKRLPDKDDDGKELSWKKLMRRVQISRIIAIDILTSQKLCRSLFIVANKVVFTPVVSSSVVSLLLILCHWKYGLLRRKTNLA